MNQWEKESAFTRESLKPYEVCLALIVAAHVLSDGLKMAVTIDQILAITFVILKENPLEKYNSIHPHGPHVLFVFTKLG